MNYIYGTWQVLRGLRAIGEDMHQDWIVRARDWLESCQNDDGGWGETCASYDDPAPQGQRPKHRLADRLGAHGPLRRASDLDQRMRSAAASTTSSARRTATARGTNRRSPAPAFPSVFYLRYDMYRNNLPLLALATYANYQDGTFHRESFYRCE